MLVLAQGVCGYQPGPLSVAQLGLSPAEPVGGVVHHSDTEGGLELLDVVPAVYSADQAVAQERRVADDDVGVRPGREDRVRDGDPGQGDQWQRVLRLPVAVDHLPVPHPQGDPGDQHGDRLDVDAADVGKWVERPGLGGQGLAGAGCQVGDALLELVLEAAQLSVGDVEEVAAAACWVEHDEGGELLE